MQEEFTEAGEIVSGKPSILFLVEVSFPRNGKYGCANLQGCVRYDPQKRVFAAVGKMGVSRRLV